MKGRRYFSSLLLFLPPSKQSVVIGRGGEEKQVHLAGDPDSTGGGQTGPRTPVSWTSYSRLTWFGQGPPRRGNVH